MAALSAPTWERVKQVSYSSSSSWFLYGWFLYTWFLYGWFLYTWSWFLYGWFLYTWFLYEWFLYTWSWFHPVPGQAASGPPSTPGPFPGPWAAPLCSRAAPSGPSGHRSRNRFLWQSSHGFCTSGSGLHIRLNSSLPPASLTSRPL